MIDSSSISLGDRWGANEEEFSGEKEKEQEVDETKWGGDGTCGNIVTRNEMTNGREILFLNFRYLL